MLSSINQAQFKHLKVLQSKAAAFDAFCCQALSFDILSYSDYQSMKYRQYT